MRAITRRLLGHVSEQGLRITKEYQARQALSVLQATRDGNFTALIIVQGRRSNKTSNPCMFIKAQYNASCL